ncbi:glycosyl transferase, family 2:glycosyl transferase, group 1 [Lachnospiraceae bacterium KM106-2]|nr:glycosyl transferase, family 2:glycosyl transferase, group 1 [Lachnospiraceae bacterium KM106-2]
MVKYKEMERIIIDKQSIDQLEEDIIIRRGLERYMYARQYVYGDVLDIACGVGYGSYLISKNPDVQSVRGYDRAEKAINQAKANFASDKVDFVLGDPTSVDAKFDVLLCLETIEHLPDPTVLKELVDRCKINEVILSFPNKKTTHYNKYHLWDIRREDVLRIFTDFECYQATDKDDSTIMNLVRVERKAYKPKRL